MNAFHMRGALLAASLIAADAHISMIYQSNYPSGIRNANSPTGNSPASVAGACSGANTFGANGIGTLTDSSTTNPTKLSLNINYAAGHASNNNAFRFVFVCGDTSQNAVRDATPLTAATNGCTAKTSGQPSTYNDAGNIGVPAPNAIVQGGYDVECTLPAQNNDNSLQCTAALVDQRNWGACVDFNLLAAAASLPPSPPPAPYVSSQGKFYLTSDNSVDSSAADFDNCNFAKGYVEVPSHSQGAASFQATLNAQADGCRTSPDATAPNSATIRVDMTFAMSLNADTGVYSGIAAVPYDEADSSLTQPYEFSVSGQALNFAYYNPANPEEQPIINDGFSNDEVQGISFGGDSGSNTTTVVVVVVVVLLLLAAGLGCFCYFRKRGGQQGAPQKTQTAYAGQDYRSTYGEGAPGGIPPPPPPPGPPPMGPPALPAGWTETQDPSSGQTYYHNAALQLTQWERPGGTTGRV